MRQTLVSPTLTPAKSEKKVGGIYYKTIRLKKDKQFATPTSNVLQEDTPPLCIAKLLSPALV